jgi:hypothetical protein
MIVTPLNPASGTFDCFLENEFKELQSYKKIVFPAKIKCLQKVTINQ